MKPKKIIIDRKYIIALVFLVIAVFTITFSTFFSIDVKMKNEGWMRIQEITNAADDKIQSSLISYIYNIMGISTIAYLYDDLKSQQAVDHITSIRIGMFQSPIRLFLNDGFAIVDGKVYKDYSQFISWEDIYCEQSEVTRAKKDPFEPERMILEFKTPVRKHEQIIGVISCTIDISALEEFVYENTKHTGAYILILDRRDDTIFVDTDHKTISNIANFENRQELKKGGHRNFHNEIYNKKPVRHALISRRTGRKKYLYSIPSKFSEWSIIAEMDDKVIFNSMFFVRKIYFGLGAILSILFIAFTLFVYIRTKRRMSNESLEYSEIANALSTNYESIYYVNLQDNSYKVFTIVGEMTKLNLNLPGKDFFKETYENLIQITYKEDLNLLKPFIDKETLLQKLQEGLFISAIYRLIIEGKTYFFRIKVINSKIENDRVIVAVENVDEEIRKEQNAQLQNMAMLQSLSDKYEAIYIIDAETGKYELHGSNTDFSTELAKLVNNENDFFKECEEDIDKVIYEPDRNELKKFFTKKNFEELFSTSNTGYIDARTMAKGNPIWLRHKVVKAMDINGKPTYVVGLTNIQEQKQQEIEKQMNEEIISILASYYSSVYYIELESEKIIPYSKNNTTFSNFDKVFHKGVKFSDAFKEYVDNYVYDADKEYLLQAGSIETIKTQLMEQKALVINYRNFISNITHYNEIKIVKVDDINHKPTAVVLGLANRDEETLNRFIDNRLYEDYIGIYYINLENDSIRTLKQTSSIGFSLFSDNLKFSEVFDSLKNNTPSEFYGECVHLLKSDFSKSYFKYANKREFNYKISSGKWHRATVFIVEREENIPIGFIFTIMEIDNQSANKIEYDTRIAEQNAILEKQQILLEQALANAEAANNAKTEFLTNMSHDIRTPMNAIIGFTELAEKNNTDSEKVKYYLDRVNISSNHLLALINNVLDMSRIESGKASLNKQPEDLIGIIKYIEEMISTETGNKNQTLIINTDSIINKSVVVDKLRLNRILLNILSNSVKYTQENGTINFTITETSSSTQGYANYEFTIEDNGMGMNNEFIKTIFDPFTRARNSTTSGIQGTGLGMAITKNLVDLMNGTIEIESQENKGTKTTVRLTLEISQPSEIVVNETDTENDISIQGMKILLVDDNDFNREIANLILTDEGVEVEEAINGQEAVDMVKNCADRIYDLILMDIQMPVMDGYEATKKIRALKNKTLSNIPIVAMTANAFEEDKRQVLKSGMNEHLAKPLNMKKLTSVLKKYVFKEAT